MAIDVVVINYHTDGLLRDFVYSYGEHRFGDSTLTVVDVDTSDRGPCYDESWMGTSYRYIGLTGNVGYARACNRGALGGSNDVILLANADTVLTDGLRVCHDALMGRDDWGVLGPRQVDERHCITAGGIFGPDRSPAQRGWAEPDTGQYSDIRDDVISVSGSLYFIKRALWKELTECPLYQASAPGAEGAFLPTPHYFEEMFCSLHARAHGYKCVYFGPIQMRHYWHKASPHGGWADQQFAVSQQMHQAACAHHGIECE